MIAHSAKLNPRVEYRRRRAEQTNESATLSQAFPVLKTLQVNAEYFDSTGATRTGGMKYKFNLTHGRSLFFFNCVHDNCIGGDYDLTNQLAEAICGKRKIVEGETRCAGTRHNNERKQILPCQGILRYKLTLGY